jgi:hypothetical protein
MILELAYPSTDLAKDPVFAYDGRRLVVDFAFPQPREIRRQRLIFDPARAFRFVVESFCQVWHYEIAYDRVAEVEQSSWLAEVEGRSNPPLTAGRHYAIAVDSWGCLEVLAAGVELLTVE